MVRKSIVVVFVLLVALLFFAVSSITAESDVSIHLEQGKNEVQLDGYYYAHELVAWNPEIEYISYYDSFLNKRVAYVNVFGGIGDNFLTSPTKVYEIRVREPTGIIIRRQ